MSIWRIPLGIRGLAAAVALTLAGPSAGVAQETWPTGPVTFLVSTGAGGSIDRMSRTLAPFLAEELGQPVVVENVGAARGIMSHDRLLRSPPDGYTILSSTISSLIDHVNSGRVPFDLDDFAYINSPSEEWAVLAVAAHTPYQTAQELIDTIRDNPGALSAAGAPGTGPGMLNDMMFDRLEIPYENVRSVVFQGGGPIMTAFMGGQVDFGQLPMLLARELGDSIRVLAEYRDTPSGMFGDVPTINEVLADYGTSMPSMNTAIRAIIVPAAMVEEYPERWEILVDAMRRVYDRPDAIAEFERLGTGTLWLGPEQTRVVIDEFHADFADYLISE